PWDQLAYWGMTVGAAIAGYAPVVGPMVRELMLGGTTVGQPALIRFYTLHCFVLPVASAFILGIHFWRVRKDGGISGPKPAHDEGGDR
ncbi:MAG: cytochrome B6, partial [Chloroflexi bacterium]|nr:cytochrome B6 [Chloroflexota bacterium]